MANTKNIGLAKGGCEMFTFSSFRLDKLARFKMLSFVLNHFNGFN